MRCININLPEIKMLSKLTGLSLAVTAAKVQVWQDKVGSDKFPSVRQLQSVVVSDELIRMFTSLENDSAAVTEAHLEAMAAAGLTNQVKWEIIDNLTMRIFRQIVDSNKIYDLLSSRIDITEYIAESIADFYEQEGDKLTPEQLTAFEDDVLVGEEMRADSLIIRGVLSSINAMGVKTSVRYDEAEAEEQTEDDMVRDTVFNRVSIEIDPLINIKTTSKIILRSISDTGRSSRVMGLRKPIGYNNAVKVLFDRLSGLPADGDLVLDELREGSAASSESWLADVVSMIEPRSADDSYCIGLLVDFVSSFTMSRYKFTMGQIRKSGSFRIFNIAEDRQARNLVNQFISNILFNYKDPKTLAGALAGSKRVADIATVLGIEQYSEYVGSFSDGSETIDKLIVSMANVIADGLKAGVSISKIYSKQNDDFKKYDVRSKVLDIARAMVRAGYGYDMMLLNAENKRIYQASIPSLQTIIIGRLNYAARKGKNSIERFEIIRKLLPQFDTAAMFDIVDNEVVSVSQWMQSILEGKSIEINIYDATKSQGRTISTNRSNPTDILVSQINAVAQGYQVAYKHGDRSLAFMYRISDVSRNIEAEGLEAGKSKAVLAVAQYVLAEVRKRQFFIDGGDVNLRKRLASSVTYAPFLNISDIAPLVNKKVTTIDDVLEAVGDKIMRYLEDNVLALRKRLDEQQLLRGRSTKDGSIPFAFDNTVYSGFLKANNKKSDAATEEFLYAVASRAYGSYVEQQMLITGDLAIHKNSSSFFKRASMVSSTGTPMVSFGMLDLAIVNSQAQDVVKLEGIGPIQYSNTPLKRSGYVSEVIVSMPSTSSAAATDETYESIFGGKVSMLQYIYEKGIYNDMLKSGFSEEDAKNNAISQAKSWNESFKNYDENDGITYINIFFLKEMVMRSEAWTQDMENTFQLELAILEAPSLDKVVMYTNEDGTILQRTESTGFTTMINPLDVKSVNAAFPSYNYLKWLNNVFAKFSPYKPQYTGPVYNGDGELISKVGGRKTSFFVLQPSLIPKGSDMDKMNRTMISQGIDTVPMKSAAKYGLGETSLPLYGEGNVFNGEQLAQKGAVSYLDVSFLKDQLTVSDKVKTEVTNSTQSAITIFSNMFNGGVPKDYEGKKEWSKMSESEKLEQSSIYLKYTRYRDLLKDKVRSNIALLEKEMGSKENLIKFVLRDALRKDSPDYIIESIEVLEQSNFLESIPAWQRLENILYSIVTNNAIRVKRNGNSYVQMPSTMMAERSGRSTYLDWYKYNDGKLEAAGVSIPIDESKMKWLFQASGKTTLFDAIEWYNKLPRKDKLMGRSLRIPNQQTSFNEVFVIDKFLMPFQQNLMIVPSETVPKAGSDFDVDKLITYLPHGLVSSKNGNFFTNKINDENMMLSNQLLASEIDILLDERNTHMVLAPSTDQWLSEDLFVDIVRRREGISASEVAKNYDDFLVKGTDIDMYSLPFNAETGQLFVEAKNNIGIVARAIVTHGTAQPDGLTLNELFVDITNPKQPTYTTKTPLSDNREMSGIFTNYGSYILSDLSTLLTSQVDALNKNYAPVININNMTLPVIAYGIRQGIAPQQLIKMINIPQIRKYIQLRSTSLSATYLSSGRPVSRSAIVQMIAKSIKVETEKGVKSGIGIFKKVSDSLGKGNITEEVRFDENDINAVIEADEVMSPEQATKAISMLLTFYLMETAARNFRFYLGDNTADTRGRKSRGVLMSYTANRNRLSDSNIIKDYTYRTGFLEAFFEGQELYDKLYGNLYATPSYVLEMTRDLYGQGLSFDELDKMLSTASSDYVLFALQNKHPIFKRYTFDKVFKGKNSVAKQLERYIKKNKLTTSALVPMIGTQTDPYSGDRIDLVKFAGSSLSTVGLNDIYTEMQQLPLKLQEGLIVLSMYQSGFSRSPFSLSPAISPKVFSSIMGDVGSLVKELSKDLDMVEAFLNRFGMVRTNYLPTYARKGSRLPVAVRSDDQTLVSTGSTILYNSFGNEHTLRYDASLPMIRSEKLLYEIYSDRQQAASEQEKKVSPKNFVPGRTSGDVVENTGSKIIDRIMNILSDEDRALIRKRTEDGDIDLTCNK